MSADFDQPCWPAGRRLGYMAKQQIAYRYFCRALAGQAVWQIGIMIALYPDQLGLAGTILQQGLQRACHASGQL